MITIVVFRDKLSCLGGSFLDSASALASPVGIESDAYQCVQEKILYQRFQSLDGCIILHDRGHTALEPPSPPKSLPNFPHLRVGTEGTSNAVDLTRSAN